MPFKASAYLVALRGRYDEIKRTTDALKAGAVAASRQLTETEHASVRELDGQAGSLFTQIEEVQAAELRDSKINALAGQLSGGGDGEGDPDDGTGGDGSGETGPEFVGPAGQRRRAGGAQTTVRDPGHYRKFADGGRHSFFGDLYHAREGDALASGRIAEHSAFMRAEMRVIDTAGEGVGVIPPKWLTAEWTEVPRQGRALSNAIRNIDIGSDPRPMTLPKQTAGSGQSTANVAEQANEGDSVSSTDAWDSDVDTVTPKPTAGSQEVTRQLLDMSTPAIDELIYGDLLGDYDDKIEAKVCAAILAVGTAIDALDGTDVTDPDHYDQHVIPAAMIVKNARKRPPNIFTMSSIRWGGVLNLRDSTGRPLVPDPASGPMNVAGVGSVDVDGRYHGLGVVSTSGFTNDDVIIAVHLASVILFEGSMLRFRYEQPAGPEKVRLGIWAYSAVKVRYGTLPIKRVEISES